MPMSVMNYDRHGMENLKHEAIKPLDRLKIPPFVVYFIVFGTFAIITLKRTSDESLDTQHLIRKNMLLAIKK